MRNLLLACLSVFLLQACSNDADPGTDTVDTVETVVEGPEGAEAITAATFPEVFRFLGTDPSFEPDRFREAGIAELDSFPRQPVSPGSMEPFRSYLIYNPDSTHAIDLYSSNVVLQQRNGQTVAQEGGPDTEVAMLDLRTDTRRRVFFTGPSVALFDARWQSDSTFLLSGAEVAAPGRILPLLWKISLDGRTQTTYTYPDTLSVRVDLFRDHRLPRE